MKKILLVLVSGLCILQAFSFLFAGCAQIGMPTGGVKDTIPPHLLRATPQLNAVQVSGNKITLSFDEYIELQDLQSNLMVSPAPKNNPLISSNLKTISIRLKDSLLPNTTYRIDFGNAIKDINEGNLLRDFSYTFSTGTHIDSLSVTGKVKMAETGKIDSTMLVLLYRNAPDSAVTTRKPDYIAKVRGDGSFSFTNLPGDQFKVYALKDGDGNKFYNTGTEAFAFYDEEINSAMPVKIELLAFEEKQSPTASTPASTSEKDKRLKYSVNLISGKQDILKPLELGFNANLAKTSTDSIVLCDTSYKKIAGYKITLDSTRRNVIVDNTWKPEGYYTLLLYKGGLEDSSGIQLPKNDTLRFQSKATADYGTLKLNFSNLDAAQHPLLQFIENDQVKTTYPLPASGVWQKDKILPGDYSIRILYDRNQNGSWDSGDYKQKIQPERTLQIAVKISVKADWDNEINIDL